MSRPTGMRAFMLIWFGQVISLLGTGMTQFALTLWAYQMTGSATALALVAFFTFGPTVLFTPIAGALVDRWNRKLVMMLSDLGSGAGTISILLLYVTGNLQIWHLYVAGIVSGIFYTFQWPAYSAGITMMLHKSQYARADGLLGVADQASRVLAPILATTLLATIGIAGVLVIDIVTFVFAVGTLLMIYIPQPQRSASGVEGKGSLWAESIYGFRYIFRRPSLVGLLMTFFFVNLVTTFSITLFAPMILARTGSSQTILATVQSIGAAGGVVGALLLSVWGGPRRRIHGVLLGMVAVSLALLTVGVGQTVALWSLGWFVCWLSAPILNGSSQAIWQSKVAPDVQGRVFAARRMIAQIVAPVSMLLAGPLADQIFEPAMQASGSLVDTFGSLVGVGPGAGMALIFVITSVIGVGVGLAGFAFPVVRNAEDLLPDHVPDETAAVAAPAAS